jgi:MFS family permease
MYPSSVDMSSQTPENKNHSRLILFIVVFLFWAGLYLYVPTLPVYVQTKTIRLEIVGLVVSMYGLWQALLRLPLGIASDWVGRRKPFILVGLALAGLGAWVMGSASGVSGLVVGRSITGLAAATWVLLVVVFSGFYPPREAVRASAILTLVATLARFLATSLTGTLNDIGGYSLAFYLAAGLSLLAIFFYLFIKETPRPRKEPSWGVTGRLIVRQDVLAPALVSAIFQYIGQATTFGFIPILAKSMGANNVQQSLLVSLSIGVNILGNLSATWAARRFPNRRTITTSVFLATAGITTAALSNSLGGIFLAQIFIGLAGGLSYPVLMGMSIEHVEDAQRSTAMGLHQAVYGIGMFVGPWLSGIIADAIGIQPMFGVMAVMSIVLGMIGIRFLR